MNESGESKTWFDGELFRSALEARWRIFYREMDLVCDYENEPCAYDSELYQPDFMLRLQRVWILVKGAYPKQEEKAKAQGLARRSGYPVYFFCGEIPNPHEDDESWYTGSALAFFSDGTMDEAYWWCECPICQSAGIEFEGRAARLPCGCLSKNSLDSDHSHYNSERILNAYRAARDAELKVGTAEGCNLLTERKDVPLI
jgi:hypothetical protein